MRAWSERQAEIASLAQRQLFFVGGAPRSGTTWVQHMLDLHPDISCRGEGHFLQYLATPLSSLMQWRRDELDAKNTKLFKGLAGYPLPAPDDFEFLVGSAILLALSQQCAGVPCRAVGEKTPENVFYFPNLKRIFPNAKFIGVARDPRDVLVSAWHLVHKTAADSDAELAAFIRRSVGACGDFLRKMLELRDRYPDDATIVTYESLLRGIAAVKPGATTGDIGAAIQTYAEAERCSVVRDFCGHGLGRLFHDEPNILHYGQKGQGVPLRPGMFFTVEPMVNLGRPQVKILSDGWTAVTRDRSLSAQFEHSVGVTEKGVEIFTLSPLGRDNPTQATPPAAA